MKGLVIRLVSQFCDVKVNEIIYRCKYRGLMRQKTQQVVVGDYVEIKVIDSIENTGLVLNIYPRKNQLLRPLVSNIDQVIIVSALKSPNFSSFLLNKYLIWIEAHKLDVILVFTKKDLINKNDNVWEKINVYKSLGYSIFVLSKLIIDEQWNLFRNIITNKISILSGQSGAGKSSILNILAPNLNLRTQEISQVLNKGKHTTTHNELMDFDNIKIIDSPGFSAFSLDDLTINQIAIALPCFATFSINCKFKQCSHIQEPNCAVKLAVSNKKIANFIYEDYLKIINQYKFNEKRNK